MGNVMTDIECAESLLDGSRNPDNAWEYFPTVFLDEFKDKANGLWYFGKKINDWMDDVAPNYQYTMMGGKSTCWKAENAKRNQSLPSDFFNDQAGRNMFTPMTRPSTRTWKDNETNVAVYIDNVESGHLGDYADLTIYRNYHSTPLTTKNAKELVDGEKGLQIEGDGYIGENFSVEDGLELFIGDDSSLSVKTTLVPNTVMHVKEMGLLQIMGNATLRLESSVLNMESKSQFVPYCGRIELDNSELNFNIGSEILDYRLDHYEIISTGQSSFHNTDFHLIGSSELVLNESSQFTILKGSNIAVSPESQIVLKEGSELVIEEGASLFFESGATINIEGHARISGKIQLEDGVNINILESSSLSLANSQLEILPNTSLKLGNNSQLILEEGTSLTFDDGTVTELGEFAEIILRAGSSLKTNNNSSEKVIFKNVSNFWEAISCEVGSSIEIEDTEFIGADFGIYGSPSFCRITSSGFYDCYNGIFLTNCTDYTINNNRLFGKGIDSDGQAYGAGITLTSCTKPLIGNSIKNFADGVKLISSSVILAKNNILDNINNGLFITGHGSKPVLVNTVAKDLTPRLNNEIRNNGLDNPLQNGAQIYMRYSAGAYLTGGYNNIYSGEIGTMPVIPCIKGIINVTVPVISQVIISAERNYWGTSYIHELNQPELFEFRSSTYNTGYSIDFDPYALSPYTADGSISSDLSSDELRPTESVLLYNALKLEDTGNSKASIKLYDHIIDKYPDTQEYYVAVSRLPELYLQEEIALDPLLATIDEKIVTETILKSKFFKGLRVATHIKAKNYDKAIMYAEEMKNEAESEEEALLSEIDIAVANMMKEAESGGKSATNISSDNLKVLFDKLNGSKVESAPSSIADNTLIPTENRLYQNYPNPFNPVTQIKFALAKTANVKLSVYNVNGQLVSELANGMQNAGIHSIDFDGSNLNSGVYYYTLEVNNEKMTKKMLLTK